MDSSEEKFGMKKSGVDPLNYPSCNISLDWRFGGGNPPMHLVPTENSFAICKRDPMSISCSTISMVDTFSSSVLDHRSPQNLGFCSNNIQTSANSSKIAETRNMFLGSLRSGGLEKVVNVGWNTPNSTSGSGGFLQTGTGVFPQSSSKFPTDSDFVERAVRFSCFNDGNFSNMMNPFSISESLNPYTNGAVVQTLERASSSGLNAVAGEQFQKNESQMAEVVKNGMPVDHEVEEDRLTKNREETGSFYRLTDEARHEIEAPGNESDGAEFSGGGQEELSVLENAVALPSAKAHGAKKRKRSNQDIEFEQGKGSPQLSVETTRENVETQQKGEQTPTSMVTKTAGKNSNYQNSDAPKEDYIHVRARRGQATNSHSLAERVRREKISERMKFLQDLVPGCSKVTGKAVMLDEIINYVQSLQRQVEFLSMKLATVNPRLDFNIEGLLSKDIFQLHGCTPSTVGFLPDMGIAHPQLHPLQHGFIQAGTPSFGSHSDLLRRTISSQLTTMNGYKEPAPQINNVWNDELNNVVQMSFGSDDPFSNEELNGSRPPGHMKVEL